MNHEQAMPPYDERDETSGQFTPEFRDEDFLAAIRERGGATTSDVADAVGCKYRTAYDRLGALEEDGHVASRKIGNTLLWEATSNGESGGTKQGDATESRERREAAEEEDAVDTTADTSGRAERREATEESAAVGERVRQHLIENDLPPKTSYGRDAIADVVATLRDHGRMETADLREAVYPGYEEKWGNPKAMWDTFSRHISTIPGIADPGKGEWEYAGDDAVEEALGGGGEQ